MKIRKNIEKTVKSLCDLSLDIEKANKKHREEFTAQETEQATDIRMMLDGLISRIYLEINTPIRPSSEETEYQLALGASFIKTHLNLHDLILEGYLIDANTLLRKQLECLARIEELDNKKVDMKSKKTPQIQNVEKGQAGRAYGALSTVAHSGTMDAVTSLLDNYNGDNYKAITLFSKYTLNSQYCMNTRIYFGICFAKKFLCKIGDWYPSKDCEELMAMLYYISNMAEEEGIVNHEISESES